MELAEKYVSSGEYFWNAGQFVWRADTLLSAIRKYEPVIAKNLDDIGNILGTKKEKELLGVVYEKMPKISIDYAVAERDRNFVVIQADFYWSDIGDWKEVWENSPKDSFGNVIIDGDEDGGEVINIDTSDASVHTDGRMIALIDVDNIVIIDTPKALLVCAKSKAQNVKKIVEKLKEKGKKDLL